MVKKAAAKIMRLEDHPQHQTVARKQKLCLLKLSQAETTIAGMINLDPSNVIDVSANVQAAKIVVEELKEMKLKYEKFQEQLIDLLEEVEPELAANDEESLLHSQEAVNRRYQEVLTKANTLITANSFETKPKPNTIMNMEKQVAKFPKIDVPSYNGNIRSFPEFKGLFDSLVHNDSNIPKVRKLHYLKEALKESDAWIYVRDISLTDIGYDEAYGNIMKRYNNKRAIINAHLHDLFSVEKISNTNGLRKLLDSFRGALSGIRVCDVDVDGWSEILSYYLCSKLDKKNRDDWEDTLKDNSTYPSYSKLCEFLENRAINSETRSMESSTDNRSDNRKPKKPDNKKTSFNTTTEVSTANSTSTTNTSANSGTEQRCVVCNANHLLVKCQQFLSLPVPDRFEMIKKNELCANCFGKSHIARWCKKEKVCKKCGYKHHTLLHRDQEVNKATTPQSNNESTATNSNATHNANLNLNSKALILPTAVAKFECGGKVGFARLLFDNCSQPTMITDSFINNYQLKTRKQKEEWPIQGVSLSSISVNRSCRLTLKSRYSSFQIRIEADVVPAQALSYKLSNVDFRPVQTKLQKFELADSAFQDTSVSIHRVDIIIGIEYYNQMFFNEPFVTINELTLHHSKFGWTISGGIKASSGVSYSHCVCSIDEELKRFWEIEEVVPSQSKTEEQEQCDRFFEESYLRNPDGRFVVRFPLKVDKTRITNNKNRALHCLYRMEKHCDSTTWVEYVKFMREYEQLGHMTLIPPNEVNLPAYYIPHHAVLRPNAVTTKLRVVFNASSSDGAGLSLNEASMIGPKVQPDLFDTLLRFRLWKVAYSADIEKMFRQIVVDQRDRDYQRILWRENKKQPVREYRLATVTYGHAPSPYLSTKCLQVLARDVEDPKVSDLILNSFYMDDLLGGADNELEAIKAREAVHKILCSAGFRLRKYISNSDLLLKSIKNEDTAIDQNSKCLESETASILGLEWKPQPDVFTVKLQLDNEVQSLTKKTLLSEIYKVFDPLGLCVPITIKGKLMMQAVWKEGIEWNSLVSNDLKAHYLEYRTELKELSKFEAPRYCGSQQHDIQIIGFCDASASAYCAAVYCRWFAEGQIHCNLLCAKSKVAPLKQITIPKLELEAALLLTKLVHRVCTTMRLKLENAFFFSDAKIVLSWLAKSPEKWQPFVSNRVRKIKALTSENQWFYVNTQVNPADLGTRGMKVQPFLESTLWRNGPEFLHTNETFHEVVSTIKHDLSIESSFVACVNTTKVKTFYETIISFSSYETLLSTFARIIQGICNRRHPVKPMSLLDARKQALTQVIKSVQAQYFSSDIEKLKNSTPLKKGPLVSLVPFLDQSGLLRVGGRLDNTSYSIDQCHPVILPGSSLFVKGYLRYLHLKYYHAGCNFLMAFVATKYRVLGLYRVVKGVVKKCLICTRYRAKTAEQQMGQLPVLRVTVNRPFSSIGTDLAGPFTIKCTRHRSMKLIKMYAAFFVCFVTRAIHIEILSELSAESFIEAFRRFMSRRGCVSQVCSDNATNFQATTKYVATLNPLLEKFAAQQGIKWAFNPPSTPHQGGLHEAAVKSAKRHLIRTANGAVFTQEGLQTMLTEVEAILNSRPLCYTTKPSQEKLILTPAHFLVGESLLVIPSPPAEDIPLKKLSVEYDLHRNRINSFWKHWRMDYLNQLQQCGKWTQAHPNIKVNEVVLIKDEQQAPGLWPYGVVIDVHPDVNGLVRNVTVLSKGAVKRCAVQNLIPLDVSES